MCKWVSESVWCEKEGGREGERGRKIEVGDLKIDTGHKTIHE